jgi:hypothetical protein
MLQGIGNWWGRQTPQQRMDYGLGGLQGGLGLLGLIQGMQRPRAPQMRMPGATPAEQQLQQMYMQRAQAAPTPQSVLTDPTVQAAIAKALSGTQADIVRGAQENLAGRGFTGPVTGMWDTASQQAQAQLPGEASKMLLNYALGAPQAHAQGLAPMQDMLSMMQRMRMGQAQAVAPRPTLLQAITQGMAPQGPMQSFDKMAALIGRAGGMPGKKPPTTAGRAPVPYTQLGQAPNLFGGYRPNPMQNLLFGGASGGLSAPQIDY